jgi:hypothetical protein
MRQIEDLDALYALESSSYPPDEAATMEKLKMRIENCPDMFLIAVDSRSDSLMGKLSFTLEVPLFQPYLSACLQDLHAVLQQFRACLLMSPCRLMMKKGHFSAYTALL